uniref:NADH-ubiquinone oxidoreductase chain 4L n=1 Tax=Stimulopalpus japonicus TaxID=209965 RepID=A0A343QCJ6_9NEOP|nr:NADH dehydrogenase subunit 4L [Stimulopalpus japonicus]ATU07143.1 NADH dehydrogenase subunit 4L [Stimulopalpus japonicus]
MINLYMYMMVFMYFLGVMSMISFSKNVLLMLLSLEFICLCLFGYMCIYMLILDSERYFLLYYLTFCVCEGSMGLSLLIKMIRYYGNDYINSLSSLKC